ncbi:MAG: transcription antitermination factor NusB [Dinoroseobacter sp.]|nr:transcription antitermination factor NusB [Dinoroseobacter sp.]
MPKPDPHGARAGALALLTGVLEDRVPLAELVARSSGPFSALPPGDRARAQRLATETLRHLRTCDQMLGPYLRLAPRLYVHNALRLATYELMALGEASHGVVSAAVDLVRRAQPGSKAPGLVNAVLRKVAQRDREDWTSAPPPSLPKAFRKPLVAAWGSKTVAAMELVQAKMPPLDLSMKDSGKTEYWAERLHGAVLASGSVRLPAGQHVRGLEGYEQGAWWVQDAAAALPARCLGDVSGMRVMDLCAAPGGKTLQLAAAGADVTALDVSAQRMTRLSENLSRTGLTARCVVADALEYTPDAEFDAILLDAPCSASGTVRRHPDLPYLRDLTELTEVTSLQAALLDKAVEWLRPGGRLVYATCSLMPEEGEAQANAVLERHPILEQTTLADVVSNNGLPATCLMQDGGIRLRPDIWAEQGGMDGFFIAGFTKLS